MADVTKLSDAELREIIETQPYFMSLPAQCELQTRLTGDCESLLLPEGDEDEQTRSTGDTTDNQRLPERPRWSFRRFIGM